MAAAPRKTKTQSETLPKSEDGRQTPKKIRMHPDFEELLVSLAKKLKVDPHRVIEYQIVAWMMDYSKELTPEEQIKLANLIQWINSKNTGR